MAGIDYASLIPNNVNLDSDKKLQRALEKWQPAFLDWWNQMGPEGYQAHDVYLRTAISTEPGGWAHFGHVKMPDYRWGIFLDAQEPDRRIPCGDHAGEPAWQEVPGEYRNILRRIIVTQADTEPASVEQQRWLAQTAPSLYDMRNLFQVNVEEGRHLWAMVYLLHAYFGKDGRDEADDLLARRAGDADKPRILDAFNQPCPDWLTFFSFTCFTDRDGKYQLGALAESGFDPLSRTCKFMLTEEAHHLSVGETGVERVLRRGAQLAKLDRNGDARAQGGIPVAMVQKWINYWFSYSIDLFGSEISTNAADFFGAGLKGRWAESKDYDEHTALNQWQRMQVIEAGKLTEKDIPLRNAMNEVLRGSYIKDCERVLKRWNQALEEEGTDVRVSLPDRKFFRRQGIYADCHFTPQGDMISAEEWQARRGEWLPSEADRSYVASLMHQVTERGKIAQWIAPPKKGIHGNAFDYEYVRPPQG
ncbi:MAG: benzoyl-CoA 2,3-epoxidase subunit BoxB [Deltaproteobacteria bacterium]|nr:benzoyl-CoA 2,3-epoxidase subunit BoxB [Deltaproteobacteria bacterium]